MGMRGELFSTRFSAQNRTYFFNVKENRKGDMFLNIVESKKQDGETFERHSVIIFDEDLEQFERELLRTLDFMKKKKGGK